MTPCPRRTSWPRSTRPTRRLHCPGLLLTPHVAGITATSMLGMSRLAQVLHDGGLPGLPVVDDAGAVTGFVSRGDIVRAAAQDPPLDLWG